MKDILNVELKVLEDTQQVVLVCSETGRQIGLQCSTIVHSEIEGVTKATATFNIVNRKPPK